MSDLGAGFLPFSMNTAGVLVGSMPDPADGTTETAIWQHGSSSALQNPSPPAGYHQCGADFRVWVNAAGAVAGSVEFCDNVSTDDDMVVPYVWQPTDGTYGAPTAAGPRTAGMTEDVYGINNAGDLLLTVNPATVTRSVQVTGAFGASPQTVPNGMYPVGLVGASQFAFVDTNGASRVAPLANPGTTTVLGFDALATSDNGYVLGRNPDRSKTFLRSPTGTQTNPPGGLDGDRGDAGVNSSGNIVTNDPSYLPRGATTPTPLANLFPAGSDFDTTGDNIYVYGIDDSNDIFGTDYLKGDTTYTAHGYLLSAPSATPPVVNSTGDTDAINSGSKGCDTGKTITVNGQSAPECTLRAAIETENAAGVTQKSITFALPSGSGAIAPAKPLPALKADGVTIDGTTGPDGLVTINGTALDQGQSVVHVSGGSDTVQGVVPELATVGVLIDGKAGHDVVRACSIGVASPTSSAGTQLSIGIKVVGSPSVTGGGASAADRNVLSGLGVGLFISGAGSSGAVVQGNYFGTDAAGDSEPDSSGVEVLDASGARIGGVASSPGAAPGNVFDGFTSSSAALREDGSAAVAVIGVAAVVSGTQVQGNLVGLNPDGATAASHHFAYGVLVGGRTSGTVIGGTGSGEGNVVSLASTAQVSITGTSTSGTQVLGNLLGTDVSGMHVIGGSTGVVVDAASTTTIGTPGAGRNVIAGMSYGVTTSATSSPLLPGEIIGSGGDTPAPGTNNVTTKSAMSTIISGDTIGPLADGTTVDPDHVMNTGVALVGIGETLGPNNQIAFTKTGVNVANNSETLVGDLIGTTPSGSNSLPNGTGVFVAAAKNVGSMLVNHVPTVRVGVPGQKPNVISGNTVNVFLPSPAMVQGNLIGTTSNGKTAVGAYTGTALPSDITYGPGFGGVQVLSSAEGSVIGGTQPGMGNVISGGAPASGSVQATGALGVSGTHTTVQGNDIGVGNDGATAVPNAGYGIDVAGGGSDAIGAPAPGGRGTTSGAGGNVVAHNGGGGIIIGKNVGGVQMLSNSVHDNTPDGVRLTDDTANSGIDAPDLHAAMQNAANTGAATDTTIVFGTTSRPLSTVQIYAAANCPSNGSAGQGGSVLFTGTTDEHGNFTFAVPVQAVGTQLDATVTFTTSESGYSAYSSGYSTCTSVAPAARGSNTTSPVKPGDTQDTDGTGFDPNENVDGSVHSTPVDLGTKTADGNGNVSFSFTVPAGLEPGQHYVVLTGESSGRSVAVPFTVAGTLTTPGVDGAFGPSGPARVLDTRNGTGAAKGVVVAGHMVAVSVTGANGIPSIGVSAVVLNVTVTGAASSGFVTAYADGADRPTASNLNYVKGQTVPNLVIAPVGADGKVDLYTSASTHLVADVAGYYLSGVPSAAGTFGPVGPTRVLDTRAGVGAPKAAVRAGHGVSVTVTGHNGVPATVSAVAVNVTVTAPATSGYVTAYAAGGTRPTASNVNFVKGQTVPNLVIVPVGADGKITLYTSAATHLVADIAGYYTTGTPSAVGAYGPVTPARLLDTRSHHGKPVTAGHRITLTVAGHGGVPAHGVSAVVVNVTVTGTRGSGFVTAYPDGASRPTASNLNYVRNQTVANLVTVPVGADGKIDLYTSNTSHLIADIAGYDKATTV